MKCPKCGSELSDGATFCPNCGSSTENGYRNTPPPRGGYNGNYNDGGGNNQNNNLTIIIIVAILAVALCIVVAIIAFVAYGNSKGKNEATPTPIPASTATIAPTAPPEPTPQIVYVTQPPATNTQASQSQSGYKNFYSDKYSFGCSYPANFVAYNDGGTLTLHTVKSPDGTADEKIVAKPNEGETPNSEYRSFLNMHPGVVEYEKIGNTYFAMSVDNGTTEYYKYCKFENGNLYWFEMSYPSSQHVLYDGYINDIYKSITINGKSPKYN